MLRCSRVAFAFIFLLLIIGSLAASRADAQPQLSVNGVAPPDSLTVAAGAAATVTLVGGPANPTDWIGLYAVGAADAAYLTWRYLGGTTSPPPEGLAGATLTFTLPTAPGSYEFRLFANNTYVRLTTSPTVIVAASEAALVVNGVAPPDAVTVAAGSPATVSVSGGPANAADWVGFYPAGAADTAYLDWRYLSGTTTVPETGVSAATLRFTMPATPGAYEFRFFVNNTYERLTTSSLVTVAPPAAQLTVNGVAPPTAVPIAAGGVATVALTGGPANATDWIGLFLVGASDGQYLTWQYLSGTTAPPPTGLADATLTFAMPAAAGSYEFRLFANNTYQRLAVSTTVVLAASAAQVVVNGVAPPDPVTAAAGSIATVSVSGGPGNRGDWVGLYPADAAEGAYLDWRYLSGTTAMPDVGVSAATLSFTMPVAPGTYEFRFFPNNTYARLTTSGPVVVPAPTAQLAVNGVLPPTPVSVAPGSPMTIAVTNGPGNATDWVGLYQADAPDAGYLAWVYLSGTTTPPETPVTNATLGFTLPSAEGTYEFRLFTNNTYQRLATSPAIHASAARPVVTIALTSPYPGTVFSGPVSIALEAAVTVTGGTVARVDFFSGAALIASAAAPPYAVTWADVPVGEYTLTATAIDSSGAATSSAPVTITVTEGGPTPGTLGLPIATPPSGVYRPPQAIALMAAPGAAIYYTLDGSEPTEASTVYTGSLTIETDTTLMARAFEVGWTPSPVLEQTYTMDTEPPVITAKISPAPTSFGWNNTDVTIRFTCTDTGSGVASCPDPIALTTEGANQIVTATATDLVGNTATTSVTVNIDKTPPTLSLTESPPPETDAGTIVIAGTRSDALSGLAQVSCNGVPAALEAAAWSCTVALAPGANPILIDATDAAGNTSSAAGRTQYGTPSGPPATALRIVPGRLTLMAGDTRALQLRDDFGRLATDASWTSSNDTVATVSEGVVTGVSGGTATVSVTSGSLSAEVLVAVVGTVGTLPYGSTRWEAGVQPGYGVSQVIAGLPDELELGSVYYALSYSLTGYGVPRVQALTLDGDEKWGAPLPVAPTEAVTGFGNSLGGVVLNVEDPESQAYSVVSVGADGASGWRYRLQGSGSAVGQSGQGVVFVYEASTDFNDSWITLLDGANGTVIARVFMAPWSSRRANVDCEAWRHYEHSGTGGFAGKLSIDGEGTGHFFVSWGHRVSDYEPCGTGYQAVEEALELWSISSTGARTVTPIARYSYSGAPAEVPSYVGGEVIPLHGGSQIITWDEGLPSVGWTTYIARNDGGSFGAKRSLGSGGVSGGVEGEQDTVFVTTWDGGVAAMDASGLATRWTVPADSIVAAVAGGGVAVQTGDTMTALDSSGAVVSSTAAAADGIPQSDGGRLLSTGTNVMSQVGEAIEYAAVDWVVPNGSLLEGSAPPNCVPPIHGWRHAPGSLAFSYYFEFDNSVSPGFSSDERALVAGEAALWAVKAGYDKDIVAADPANTIVKRATLRSPTLGETVFNRTYAYWPPEWDRFGIAPDKWGVIIGDDQNMLVDFNDKKNPYHNRELFKSVALHEFGHLIGLGHVPTECGIKSIMTVPMLIGSAPIEPTDLDVRAVTNLKETRR